MEIHTDKKSALLFVIIFIAIVVALFVSYQKFINDRDFFIFAWVSCDPDVESCFLYQEEGEEDYPYKVVYRKAYAAPACEGGDCPELECSENEEEQGICYVYLCSEENQSYLEIEDECSS